MSMSIPLMASYRIGDGIVPIATSGIEEEDARRRSRGTEGPSIAWELGHICQYRAWALRQLGREVDYRFEGVFSDAPSDGSDYPTMDELRAEFARLGEEIQSALGELSDEALNAPVEDDLHGAKSILDQFMFFPWHEAYHMGQLSSLRSAMGFKPTSVIVQEGAGTG